MRIYGVGRAPPPILGFVCMVLFGACAGGVSSQSRIIKSWDVPGEPEEVFEAAVEALEFMAFPVGRPSRASGVIRTGWRVMDHSQGWAECGAGQELSRGRLVMRFGRGVNGTRVTVEPRLETADEEPCLTTGALERRLHRLILDALRDVPG